MKLKLLITGANGQLGRCFRELASDSQHHFIFTDVDELDITNVEAVRLVLKKELPDFIINCAAYTAVDKAECDIELANMLNARAAQILADEAQRYDMGIVQISTDYVFMGNEVLPRKEDDSTRPISIYGITKLKGEKYAS